MLGFGLVAAGLAVGQGPGPGETLPELRAEQDSTLSASLTMRGQVWIGDDLADSGTVVLHQVSALFSGALDSTGVDPSGTFELQLPGAPSPAEGDVYFASVRYDGVLYFGEALTSPAQLRNLYSVQAYRAIVPGPGTIVSLRTRNIFLEHARPGPGWEVTDLFEVQNPSRYTLVAGERSGEWNATWSHALPPGVTDFVVGQSDLSPNDGALDRGRVLTTAALPPGESVYLFRYRLPDDAVTIPQEGNTASMELLISEPAGVLTVTGLASADPVDLEGRTFRRFAGREMSAGRVVVQPGRPMSPARAIPLLAVALALALTGAGALLVMRRRPPATAVTPAVSRRRTLAEVARLDEARQQGRMHDDEYRRRRDRLLEELQR